MNKAERYLQQWNNTDRKSYISTTKAHLDFLASVANHPSLVHGDHLDNAVRRYQHHWLPLCKKRGTMCCDEWAAPLDVAWVWYLHMLSPANYVDDCIRLIGNAPNHAIKSGKALQTALVLTRDLWNKSTQEPFDVDFTKPIVTAHHYTNKLPHDFKLLSLRQWDFFYQVSLPHYHDDQFLDAATKRYVAHLGVQMRNPSSVLSAPVDVQLISYSHQLNPIFYHYQIDVILGRVVDSVYLLDVKENISREIEIDKVTREVWSEAGLEYCKPGACYRGTPLSVPFEGQDESSFLRPVEYSVSVTKIELGNLDLQSTCVVVFEGFNGKEMYTAKIKKEKVKSYLPSRDSESGVEYVQLEDFTSNRHGGQSSARRREGYTQPRYSLLNGVQESTDDSKGDVCTIGDGNTTLFQFNTSTTDSSTVVMSLYDVNKHKSKVLMGKSDLDIFTFLASLDVNYEQGTNQKQTICLPIGFPSDCPAVRVTLTVTTTGRGHHVFQVSPEYGFAKFSRICKALTYPTLMLPLSTITGTQAEVMTYPISDYRGEVAFSCRIVRSVGAADPFYAIEVLDKKRRVTATSHLLSHDALPYKNDLNSPQRCAYFSPDESEAAMLIRGRTDWGVCIAREVNSPHFVGPKTFQEVKLFSLRDRTYCYVRKFKNSSYMFKFNSSESSNSYVYLHLSEGSIVMSGDITTGIPEVLALALSVLVLRYLFCEKNHDCWALIDDEGLDLLNIFQSSDNVGSVWNGKYDGGEEGEDEQCSFVSEINC